MSLAAVRAKVGARRGWISCALAASAIQVAVGTLASKANAQDFGVKDFKIHQQYVSPRALGMGNAFVAVADDYSALFYNPAGLARLTEGQINMGLTAGGDPKLLDLIDDISKASDSDNVQDMIDVIDKNMGNHYSARIPALGAFWVRPKWGIAVLPVDVSIDFEPHKRGLYSLDMVATQDTTIAYGRGWDVKWFKKARLSMGVTGKLIYRGYYNRAILASELINDTDFFKASDAAEGFTADVDFGMLYTPNVDGSWLRFFRPTLGFVVHNIGDYGFKTNFHLIDKNSKEPPKLQRRADVGLAFELPDWWVWKTRFMADVKDMGVDNWTFKKGSHAGAEFLWKIRSWWQGGWRVGLNQGYFTAGATAKFGIFNLDLVTYAEDVGPSNAPKSVRNYMVKTSLDW